jgi:hypothetical protein
MALKQYAGAKPLRIPIESGSLPRDLMFGPFDMPIITQVLGKEIKALAPADVQLVPAMVGDLGVFDVMNLLASRNAIHEGKSEILKWTEFDGFPEKISQLFAIGRLVLAHKGIQDTKIFRLQGWQLPIIVSAVIRKVFEDSGATGVRLKEIDLA